MLHYLLEVDQGGRRKQSEEMSRIRYNAKRRNTYYSSIGDNREYLSIMLKTLYILQRHNHWHQRIRPPEHKTMKLIIVTLLPISMYYNC